MDSQQVIALVLVAVAAAYLLRQVASAVRDYRSYRAGCGSACSGCAFVAPQRSPAEGSRTVIPIAEIEKRAGAPDH